MRSQYHSDVVPEPVDLSLARMKHISTNCLVEMWEYIVDNPQFLVNSFIIGMEFAVPSME